mmetsp:Transcript_67461/g.113020  ORF Transcript_67461/g.113020 Transcript_67461/m.113020 type:complete len:268 (-) Transcript_67461:495-1298(-)
MLKICTRPSRSGSPISMWTSKRPGRIKASSSMSLRFVIPMTITLLTASTPSIFDSNWLTTLSPTPVPSREAPRCLQIASISSKMIRCRSLSSPFSAYSASASANKFRMFSSDWPTYLFRISGPLTFLGSLQFSILPICRAISVFPVPGGPCSRIPLTCVTPSFSTIDGGKIRDPNARRNTAPNSVSRPPMPSVSKFQSFLNTSALRSDVDSGMLLSLISLSDIAPTFSSGFVSRPTIPMRGRPWKLEAASTVMLTSSMTAKSTAFSR